MTENRKNGHFGDLKNSEKKQIAIKKDLSYGFPLPDLPEKHSWCLD